MLAWGPGLALTTDQQPECQHQLVEHATNEEAAWSPQCRSKAGKPAQAYLEWAQMATDRHIPGDKLPQKDTI